MSVTYSSAAKSARMTAIRDLLNGGTLQIGTSGMSTVLATLTLAGTSGSVSGAVLTLSAPVSDSSADASGTAAAARLRDSSGNDVVTGLTVGTSGAEVVLDSTTINAGQSVTITSATLTHA